RWIDFALEGDQQLRIRLADAKGSVHHAHQRHWVRRNFHQLVVPRSQSLLGSILEVHGLTRHANPVLIGVNSRTWLVDRAAVDGAKHRGVDWTGFNTGNFCGELAQERLDRDRKRT